MKKQQPEAFNQASLFMWAQLQKAKYPELAMMFHIPNGGSRNKLEAANLKRQGVKAGVPDIFLPVARSGYHGLFIEMKAGKNKPTASQTQWLISLLEEGYLTAVCYSFEEASKVILRYITEL